MTASKFDSGKPKMSLLDPRFMIAMAVVLGFGEEKYGPANWMKGLPWSKLIDSAERHLAMVKMGEVIDYESGMPHLAHLACNAMMLNWMMEHKIGTEDLRFDGSSAITGRPGADTRPIDLSSFEAAQDRIASWADSLMPDRTPEQALRKLIEDEIPELLEGGGNDPLEWADVFILVLDCAKLRGIDIVKAVHEKMAINESRRWIVKPNGLIQHIGDD